MILTSDVDLVATRSSCRGPQMSRSQCIEQPVQFFLRVSDRSKRTLKYVPLWHDRLLTPWARFEACDFVECNIGSAERG